jgi:Flp pilus assembly protein TadD
VRAHPADPAVVRALAVYYGLDGDLAEAARLVARARVSGAPDPWIDFAEMAAQAGAAGRAGSLPILTALVAAHPELVRPRMMLARTLFDLGRAEEALAALDDLLALSPEHDRAKRLKAAILSPPPAQVDFVPAPADAPPPRPTGLLPRKPKGGG